MIRVYIPFLTCLLHGDHPGVSKDSNFDMIFNPHELRSYTSKTVTLPRDHVFYLRQGALIPRIRVLQDRAGSSTGLKWLSAARGVM